MSSSTVITGGVVPVISYPAAGLASYLEDLVVLEVALSTCVLPSAWTQILIPEQLLGSTTILTSSPLCHRRNGQDAGMRSPLTANPAPTPRIACLEFGTEGTSARCRGGALATVALAPVVSL